MKKSCQGSGDVLDDDYVEWRYPKGLETEKCRYCDAVRKPVVVERCIGWPRHKDFTRLVLIFPYHKRVKNETAS